MIEAQCARVERLSPTSQQARTTIRKIWSWLVVCWSTWRERRQLRQLEPHLLADIGITREMAEGEAARHFWQLSERHRDVL